jgi:cell division protein FtsB
MDVKQRSVKMEVVSIVFILICLGLIGFSIFGRQGALRLQDKETELESIQQEIQRLEKENTALRARIEKLENDPVTQEQEIRKKMMYAKSGETVYQVAEPEAKHEK